MKRRLARCLTGLSLALLVPVAALWVRSYGVTDQVQYGYYRTGENGPTLYWHVIGRVGRGGAVVGFVYSRVPYHPTAGGPAPLGWTHETSPPEKANYDYAHFAGFGWRTEASFSAPGHHYRDGDVAFPLAFPTFLLALPGAVMVLRRMLRPYPPGHCRRCGYDLRATPGRCPECGTPAEGARHGDRTYV
jgi:hypothetical protein